jgi:hypothetical protein
MNSSWTKLGISVGLLAAIAACSVTTGPFVPDEGGIFGDAGTADTSTTQDSGSDLDSGGSCTLVKTINNSACTTCLQASCCAEVNACFTPMASGADSDCDTLQNCINTAIDNDPTDGGGPDAGGKLADDIQLCRDSHPDSVALEQAWVTCLSNHCSAECNN